MDRGRKSDTSTSCPTNQTMFQAFEWNCPSDHQHWQRLARSITSLSALGVSHMWIPPAAKGSSPHSNGYDIYDLYDLGEFHQKGTTATKWGTKAELVDLVDIARTAGIKVLFDAVLNHKAAADATETTYATQVDPEDRTESVGDPTEIETWTAFNFEGRDGAYSSLKWNKFHFTGVDYDDRTKSVGVWRLQGKEWAKDVDEELGNYDYLMFADIDHRNSEVRKDLFHWVEWLQGQLKGLGGFRLDAIKHYSASFVRDLVRHVDAVTTINKGREQWFIVGEYWREEVDVLSSYIEYMNHRISLFDIQLVKNFSWVSSSSSEVDLRRIFDGSLVRAKPKNAVTFVTNHDTQPGGSLETIIASYFVPMAYAILLLRNDTGLPCVFFADLYGCVRETQVHGRGGASSTISYHPPIGGGLVLPKLMLTRLMYAYGEQVDYFDDDDHECIGFTRLGHPSHYNGAGIAVLINNSWVAKKKKMNVGGRRHAGETWTDILCWSWGTVTIDEDGWGEFYAPPRSVSVWASKTASGRDRLDGLRFDYDIYNGAGLDTVERKAAIAKEKARERKRKSYPDWLAGSGGRTSTA